MHYGIIQIFTISIFLAKMVSAQAWKILAYLDKIQNIVPMV